MAVASFRRVHLPRVVNQHANQRHDPNHHRYHPRKPLRKLCQLVMTEVDFCQTLGCGCGWLRHIGGEESGRVGEDFFKGRFFSHKTFRMRRVTKKLYDNSKDSRCEFVLEISTLTQKPMKQIWTQWNVDFKFRFDTMNKQIWTHHPKMPNVAPHRFNFGDDNYQLLFGKLRKSQGPFRAICI